MQRQLLAPATKQARSITLQQQHLMHFTCTLRLCVAVFHPHCSHGQLMGQLLHWHNDTEADGSSNEAGMQQHFTTAAGGDQVVCTSRLCVPVLVPTDSLVHSTGAISAVTQAGSSTLQHQCLCLGRSHLMSVCLCTHPH
jgi:hypothetical protein